MRWGLLIPVVLLFLAGAATSAEAQLRFGARAGYADYDGSAFLDSGDLGDVVLVGAQIVFPVLDRVELEIAGEGTSEDLEFETTIGEDLVAGDAEWNDLAIYASLRLRLLPVLAGVAHIYGGGGIGAHFTEVSIEDFDEALADYVDEVEEEDNDFEWNALAGVAVELGSFLEIFGEGRYRDITGENRPEGYAIYAGFNLMVQ